MEVVIKRAVDCDVAVVGAGPAGAAIAIHLCQSGLSTVLLDRCEFPRDKVCGDFVGPVALVELERLGVTALPGYRGTNVIRRAALYLEGRELISRMIPSVDGLPSYGRVIPRFDLDDWILDRALAAGARFHPGCRVTGFETDGDGITLAVKSVEREWQLHAHVLVGADGSDSAVSRALRGQTWRSDSRIVAVRAYFNGTSGDRDQADLYFTGESFPGYCWLFPTSVSASNVGVGMMLETVPQSPTRLRELLLGLIENDAALGKRLSGARISGKVVGWPLSTYDPRAPLVSDRVVLIGDAAGLINPLNGEGIQYALLSARWAAAAIRGADTDGFSRAALAPYAERVEAELRYDMALANFIVQFIRNRSLTPVWLEALRLIAARARSDPDYAEIAGGILAGLLPASSAVSVDFVRKTAEQAATSLGVASLLTVLHGPKALSTRGIELASAGLGLAVEAVSHPFDLVKWGAGIAAGAGELGWQVAKHAATKWPIEAGADSARVTRSGGH